MLKHANVAKPDRLNCRDTEYPSKVSRKDGTSLYSNAKIQN